MNLKTKQATISRTGLKQAKSEGPSSKLNRNFYQRSISGIIMILAFILILAGGQTYCALLVLFINFMLFHQLSSLKRNYEKQSKIPIAKYFNWYIYFIVTFYSIIDLIQQKFEILILEYPHSIGNLCKYHNFITCLLSIIAIIAFVTSLKQNYLRYQFKMFAWICSTGFLVIYPSYYIIKNCFEGLFWFAIPALLINVNDIFAYLFGYFFGKNQLIAISPKKTWQGYIGGAMTTIIFTFILINILEDIPGITCRLFRPTLTPLYFQQCEEQLLQQSALFSFHISKLTVHTVIIGLFVSLIGPFGGFFASGLKRSIKIKDFNNLIPGHGGVSDRMDCQIIIGVFTYFYLHNFIRVNSYDSMLSVWISTLTLPQKLSLYNQLSGQL